MLQWRAWAAVAAVVLALAGCGGVPGVSEGQANALMEEAGQAVADQDWAALAALHWSGSGLTAEALGEQIGGYLASTGPLSNVTSTTVEVLTDAAKAELVSTGVVAAPQDMIRCQGVVVVGNGPEPNSPAFEALRIDAYVGEENGRYVLLSLANAVIID